MLSNIFLATAGIFLTAQHVFQLGICGAISHCHVQEATAYTSRLLLIYGFYSIIPSLQECPRYLCKYHCHELQSKGF